MNESPNGFGNQRLQLFGGSDHSIPQVLRALPAPFHSQQCVIMINDRFRNDEGFGGVVEKARHSILHSGELRSELCCGFRVSVQPFLNELNLIPEMV